MNPPSLPKGSTYVSIEPGLDFLRHLTSGIREKSHGEINQSSAGGGGCCCPERKRGTKEKEA